MISRSYPPVRGLRFALLLVLPPLFFMFGSCDISEPLLDPDLSPDFSVVTQALDAGVGDTDESGDGVCEDGSPVNACGGCGVLENEPGDVCGRCGEGIAACSSGGTTTCDGDLPRTANTVCLSSGGDTYVQSLFGSSNHGNETALRIQSAANHRTLIQFDQGGLEDAIDGRAVVSAYLEVEVAHNYGLHGIFGRPVDIHALTVPWTEDGATWECAIDSNTSNFWPNCSGATEWEMARFYRPDLHPWVESATDSVTIYLDTNGTLTFDVTSDVAAFADGGFDHSGWLLRNRDEILPGWIDLAASESGNPPLLVVEVEGCPGGFPQNSCGGCGPLGAEPGDGCGPCGLDSISCLGTDSVLCSGATLGNDCGGCATLDAEPGESCGPCGWDTVECDGTEASFCNGFSTNECSGCEPLAASPGDTCGVCDLDEYTCDGPDLVTCSGDTALNSCGGCFDLVAEPGEICGSCGDGNIVCNGVEAVTCHGAAGFNACGGCGELDGAIGDSCGTCGLSYLECDGFGGLRCSGDDAEGDSACLIASGDTYIDQVRRHHNFGDETIIPDQKCG